MMIAIIKTLFSVYTLMLLARILSSWVPSIQNHKIVRFICFYTDPYLNLFRKIIPPIGGVIDLSPLLAFFSLQLLEAFILRLL